MGLGPFFVCSYHLVMAEGIYHGFIDKANSRYGLMFMHTVDSSFSNFVENSCKAKNSP